MFTFINLYIKVSYIGQGICCKGIFPFQVSSSLFASVSSALGKSFYRRKAPPEFHDDVQRGEEEIHVPLMIASLKKSWMQKKKIQKYFKNNGCMLHGFSWITEISSS